MKITKRSVRRHHAYQRRLKIYIGIGACVIIIGLLHVAIGLPSIGNDPIANSVNGNNRSSPIQRLISTRQQSRQLKFYQQQQIEDCKNFPVLVHQQNQDEDDKWETIEHPVSSYWHWDQNVLEEEAHKLPRNFLKVPHFHATKEMREYLGNYGERLMTKDQAQSIGSYVMLDRKTWKRVPQACEEIHKTPIEPTSFMDDADDDVVEEAANEGKSPYFKVETINVMLASFRDGTMCKNTLKGLFHRAKFGRIRPVPT